MASAVARVLAQLARDIENGVLPPGTALPTHRALAKRHGIAVASASKVYARLREMGLVIGNRSRDVRARPPAAAGMGPA